MNRAEVVTPANTAATAARPGWLTARVVAGTAVLFVALAPPAVSGRLGGRARLFRLGRQGERTPALLEPVPWPT